MTIRSDSVSVDGSFATVNGGATITEANGGGLVELVEATADAAAPVAGKGRLYLRDNGLGKVQLVARFPSGAVQVIATEP